MMRHMFLQDPILGRLLRLTDGRTVVDATLDCGIRLVTLCAEGRKNLFYRQPGTFDDGLTTPEGWRLYGGHRLWAAPETDLTYCPDNDPVDWSLTETGVLLTQKPDPWQRLQKSVALSFQPDGSLSVCHTLKNCGDTPISAAAWVVSTLAPGGRATVPLHRHEVPSPGTPHRAFALWGTATLGDPRLTLEKDALTVRQDGSVEDYFKLGIYSDEGRVDFENLGQRLTVTFTPHPIGEYTDLGCNIELYANPRMQEVETLGVFRTLAPGDTVTHTEHWLVTALDRAVIVNQFANW